MVRQWQGGAVVGPVPLTTWPFCVDFAHSSCMCRDFFLPVLCLLSPSKDAHVKSVNACLCRSPAINRQPVHVWKTAGNRQPYIPKSRISSDRNWWMNNFRQSVDLITCCHWEDKHIFSPFSKKKKKEERTGSFLCALLADQLVTKQQWWTSVSSFPINPSGLHVLCNAEVLQLSNSSLLANGLWSTFSVINKSKK